MLLSVRLFFRNILRKKNSLKRIFTACTLFFLLYAIAHYSVVFYTKKVFTNSLLIDDGVEHHCIIFYDKVSIRPNFFTGKVNIRISDVRLPLKPTTVKKNLKNPCSTATLKTNKIKDYLGDTDVVVTSNLIFSESDLLIKLLSNPYITTNSNKNFILDQSDNSIITIQEKDGEKKLSINIKDSSIINQYGDSLISLSPIFLSKTSKDTTGNLQIRVSNINIHPEVTRQALQNTESTLSHIISLLDGLNFELDADIASPNNSKDTSGSYYSSLWGSNFTIKSGIFSNKSFSIDAKGEIENIKKEPLPIIDLELKISNYRELINFIAGFYVINSKDTSKSEAESIAVTVIEFISKNRAIFLDVSDQLTLKLKRKSGEHLMINDIPLEIIMSHIVRSI